MSGHKIYYFWLSIVLALVVSGCSVEVNQPPVAVSPGASTAEPNASETLDTATTKVAITWGDLNLIGKLVYTAVNSTTGTVGVQLLDLETGNLVSIFQTPRGGWADAAAVSPDHKTLVLAYSPPMEAPYGGQQSLYTMPMDAPGPPELLIIPPTDQDQFSQPVWSPDGKYVYFAHINYESMTMFEIMRMVYPNGTPEKIVDHAYWPRLSDDSARLLYVSLDPQTGVNSLFFANPDGTNAHQVPINGLPVPNIIDVPMFSPDNQSIILSSPVGVKASAPNWMDRLLGARVALADGSLPSDWWSVPTVGGTATQLTNIQSLALYGAFSPDKKYIASYSTDGIFIMKPDGSEVTNVVNDVGGISGTVNWIP